MGTRAQVIIKTDGDYVKYYHHWDGDIEQLGRYLTSLLHVTYWEYPSWGNSCEKIISEFIKHLDTLPEFEKEDEWITHSDAEYLYYIKPHTVMVKRFNPEDDYPMDFYDVFFCTLRHYYDSWECPISKTFYERGIEATIMEDKFKDYLESELGRESL